MLREHDKENDIRVFLLKSLVEKKVTRKKVIGEKNNKLGVLRQDVRECLAYTWMVPI